MMLVPEPIASIYVAAVGLVVGSFLNVCIYRLPLGESVVRPRSRCPSCKVAIAWYQNIPVFSWIALGGKCGACRQTIPWRYPFVEALSGGVVLALWHLFGLSWAFPIAAFFALAMIVLFYTDLDHQLLPDAVTLTGFFVGLAVAWFNPFLDGTAHFADGSGWSRVGAAVSGAALGSGVLWGVGALWKVLRGVEAMGMGDVKMMALVGAFTGPAGVGLTIFAASFVGAVVGLALVPLRGRSLQDALPFGCFLAPAAVAALPLAARLAEPYFSQFRMLVGGS